MDDSRLITRLEFRENVVRNLNYEKCYVFNEKGDIIFRKGGDESKILFTEQELSKIRYAKVFIHNHPVGTSFSTQDIQLAFILKIGEMRAIGQKYDYSIKISQRWTDSDWDSFTKEISKIDNDIKDVFDEHINEDLMTIEEANMDHWHTVWLKLSESYSSFNYKRIERKK